MIADSVEELRSVLNDERSALLEGNYAALAQIAAQKDACLANMEQNPPSAAILKHIKDQLAIHQDMTAAALEGVKGARTRITELEKVRDGLTTYDLSGKMAVVPTHHRRIEKKA